MTGIIFRRLQEPTEEYLSKINRPVVEMNSTETPKITDNISLDREEYTRGCVRVTVESTDSSDRSTITNDNNLNRKKRSFGITRNNDAANICVDKDSMEEPVTEALIKTKPSSPTPVTPESVQNESKSNESVTGRKQNYVEESEKGTEQRVGSDTIIVEDDSSSDDDSYFATHLPRPKSGRSFSVSSNRSNSSALCASTGSSYKIFKTESDASLSFSDESDEDHNTRTVRDIIPKSSSVGVHLSPVVHPNRSVVDMNLYPQKMTKMQSVNSLVRSNSNEQLEDRPGARASSTGNVKGGPIDDATNPDKYGDCDDKKSVLSSPEDRQRSYTGDDSMSTLPSVANVPDSSLNKVRNDNHCLFPGATYMPYNYQQQQMYWQQLSGSEPPGYAQHHQKSNPWCASFAGMSMATGDELSLIDSNMAAKASSGSIPFVYSEDDDVMPLKGHETIAISLGTQQAGGAGSNGGSASYSESGLGKFGNNPGPGTGPNEGLIRGSSPNGGNVNAKAQLSDNKGNHPLTSGGPRASGRQTFKVYWQRWIMLFYMSCLNLLSDWTCYSVAPISLLTEEAFGNIDPERLVVVFLGANAIATACEPILLARLGLRKTVLLGSLLLMIGSIVKSGGLPPIIPPNLEKGHAEFSLYLGFFIVGLSQPLYQCTPALLSASWFPEEERTMATGVALNANQLGIGFAFIFGTLLVSKADDIPSYFGLLSQISTVVFIGTLIQFDDAPPTPPSSSAKVVRGSLNFNMPNRMRNMFSTPNRLEKAGAEAPSPASSAQVETKRAAKQKKSNRSSTRRRNTVPKVQTAITESGLLAPSSAHYGSTEDAMQYVENMQADLESFSRNANAPSPSPAIGTGRPEDNENSDLGTPQHENPNLGVNPPTFGNDMPITNFPPGMPPLGPYGYSYPVPYQQAHLQAPSYWDQRMHEQMQQQAYHYQQQLFLQQMQQQQQLESMTGEQPQLSYPPLPPPLPYSYQHFPPHLLGFDPRYGAYDPDVYEDGAEPTVTVTDNHLDIDIRDDQVIRSLHACMIRPGFSHALAAFTVSGIVINTLSTYMDYLVRLNGAPRTYTGIVGGAFQFAIMISSLIVGKQTDNTRAYYSVSIGMLVLGAFGLAECGVSLDSDRGGDLRWSLLLVAVLVGPLQPISTELGVEVAYPLSENTVLVIQQLFSNLLSAIFIPFFKSLKDIGTQTIDAEGTIIIRPDYTFSFYLLIVIHTVVTVYVATFNGKYLRYEHELQKKVEEDAAERGANDEVETSELHPLKNKMVM